MVLLPQPPTLQNTRTTRQRTKNVVPGFAKIRKPNVVEQIEQMISAVISIIFGVIRIASFEMTGGRTNEMISYTVNTRLYCEMVSPFASATRGKNGAIKL